MKLHKHRPKDKAHELDENLKERVAKGLLEHHKDKGYINSKLVQPLFETGVSDRFRKITLEVSDRSFEAGRQKTLAEVREKFRDLKYFIKEGMILVGDSAITASEEIIEKIDEILKELEGEK